MSSSTQQAVIDQSRKVVRSEDVARCAQYNFTFVRNLANQGVSDHESCTGGYLMVVDCDPVLGRRQHLPVTLSLIGDLGRDEARGCSKACLDKVKRLVDHIDAAKTEEIFQNGVIFSGGYVVAFHGFGGEADDVMALLVLRDCDLITIEDARAFAAKKDNKVFAEIFGAHLV